MFSRYFHRRQIWWTAPPPLGVLGLDKRYIIDVDESGIYLVLSGRKRGYSFVGREAAIVEQYTKGVKLNLLLALGSDGVINAWVTLQNTNADVRIFPHGFVVAVEDFSHSPP
jgi:hypothetical protein